MAKRKPISYEKKQGFVGFMFILPWFIGFLMFFFVPAIKSIQFSLSNVKIFENIDYAPVIAKENSALTQSLSPTMTVPSAK